MFHARLHFYFVVCRCDSHTDTHDAPLSQAEPSSRVSAARFLHCVVTFGLHGQCQITPSGGWWYYTVNEQQRLQIPECSVSQTLFHVEVQTQLFPIHMESL